MNVYSAIVKGKVVFYLVKGISMNIYLVCGNTMCVSTLQVEFVLRELSCFYSSPQQ